MAQIPIGKYNTAKAALTKAGSKSAAKSHTQHGAKECPDEYGKQMLREARDEFRKADKGQAELKSEMTQAHYDAIHTAAKTMGISNW